MYIDLIIITLIITFVFYSRINYPKKDLDKAYELGKNGYLNRLEIYENPFININLAKQWDQGWRDAHNENSF